MQSKAVKAESLSLRMRAGVLWRMKRLVNAFLMLAALESSSKTKEMLRVAMHCAIKTLTVKVLVLPLAPLNWEHWKLLKMSMLMLAKRGSTTLTKAANMGGPRVCVYGSPPRLLVHEVQAFIRDCTLSPCLADKHARGPDLILDSVKNPGRWASCPSAPMGATWQWLKSLKNNL